MDFNANKLLPVLGILLLVIALVVGVKACTKPSVEATAQTLAPATAVADADGPADTLRALTAQVADMKLEAERLRTANEAAQLKKDSMSLEIADQVRRDLDKTVQAQQAPALATIFQRMDELGQRLNATGAANSNGLAGNAVDPEASGQGQPGNIIIEPINNTSLLAQFGSKVSGLKDKLSLPFEAPNGGVLHGLADNSVLASHLPGGLPAGSGQAGAANSANLPEPVYTVPRNATLLGSTGLTALVGRIPIKGNVDDPFPFKVIVGSDNLAANGLDIPGLDGMVFSGTALGDWALSCVRGTVHSVTFVFEDGTIRTLSSDDQSLANKSRDSALAVGQNPSTQGSGQASNTGTANGQGRGGQSVPSLGFISDRRGIPCVTGSRISNAVQYLGGRFLARAIGAAGAAYARSQATVTSSPLTGGVTSGVTGNANQFALGSLAAGGADELAQAIADRQTQNYDVVFVDSGAEIVLHIDRELPIDLEPNGRKLTYARKPKIPSPASTSPLD
ncbi:MAG: TIGR03752 family integrating conjugative element protein [Candidatus Paceibacterota bacterium]|jgi:integrating conjugative element protein (TIGR03752 family)